MRQKPLTDYQKMDAVAFLEPDDLLDPEKCVDHAASIARYLTKVRTRGPGDTDNAMRGVAHDYRLDYWTLWKLRYKRQNMRDIGTSILFRLRAAYRAERARQRRLLTNEIPLTEETAWPDFAGKHAALAMVGEDVGEVLAPMPASGAMAAAPMGADRDAADVAGDIGGEP